MQDKDVRNGPLQTLLIPIFFGALLALGTCCLLLLFCAALVYAGMIPETFMVKLCILFVALCAIFGGRYAVKRGEGAPLLLGAVTGLLLFLLLLGIAYMGYEQAHWQGCGLWLFLAAVLGGSLAGMTKQSRSKKAKKRKKH